MSSQVPVIDLAPRFSGDGEAWAAVAADVDGALRSAGFFLIGGHGPAAGAGLLAGAGTHPGHIRAELQDQCGPAAIQTRRTPLGAMLGATRMNDLAILRTRMNSGRRCVRGHGPI